MLDTSEWPATDLHVLKDIHLDPKNVRLEIADAKVEADIMEDLFVNEKALELVDGICRIGYLTHETPIVLLRDNKYVVVEGNRRLAALKAIQNPMLVPEYQARVTALASLLPDRNSLAKIRVMVAPSQAEADQLIAAIHTGNLRRPWTPSRQAAFFQAQIDAGRRLNELISRYPTIKVSKFVFRANIINLFKAVDYGDAELQDYLNTKKWARGLSTLARIYESRDFLALTGLTMQDDGSISHSLSEAIFGEVATEIVRGMYQGDINTRSLNTVKSPRYKQLMVQLHQIVEDSEESADTVETDSSHQPSGKDGPQTSPKPTDGAAPPDDNLSKAAPGAGGTASHSPSTGPKITPSAEPAAKNAPAKKSKPKYLDLGQVKPPDSYPEALKLLLGELSEIRVQKFPNGTFLMIRAALEKSIKAFAEGRKIEIKETGNNSNGRVQLGHALTWLLSYVKSDGPAYLIQVVEGVRTGKIVPYTNSSDSLNAINHNHHYNVTPDQVFEMWGSIDSIMRYLMKP